MPNDGGELDPYVPLMRATMSAQEFTQLSAGEIPPAPPPEQPPPPGMPPLRLVVLDALVGDDETLYSMRSCGEAAPSGVALVGERHLLDTLRELLSDGLVEVSTEYVRIGQTIAAHRVTGDPPTSDDDLRRYWFRITPAGLEVHAESDLEER